jgi:hypothetical protein
MKTPVMKIFILSIAGLLYSTAAISAGLPTMSCRFDDAIAVSHDRPNDARRTKIRQNMKIILGVTDDATLSLDGGKRATNSRNWMPIQLSGWETWETTFVGDFGELLTIEHELGANRNPLKGGYKASLVSTGTKRTQITLGSCLIE